MNKRLIMVIIIAAAVLLLATLVLLLIALGRTPATNTTTDNTNTITTNTTVTTTTTTTTSDTTTDSTTNTTTSEPVPPDDETALRRVVNNFTERFGSYSTDTNYENITLARSLMTATMSKTADTIIANNAQQSDTFYSVESRVMTTTLTDYAADATGATAEVDVRQTIVSGQTNPTYRNQSARLTLVKAGDTWKVDSFKWL
jgi:ABC-type glycerol-3-phosphate transport system substrate-binding protein